MNAAIYHFIRKVDGRYMGYPGSLSGAETRFLNFKAFLGFGNLCL